VPRLCELYLGICLTTEEKAQQNLSQGSRRVPAGTMNADGMTEETKFAKLVEISNQMQPCKRIYYSKFY